ncbi:MAG: Ig domain-containing protein [Chthoniobacteraceae bacterium]
MPIPVIDPTRSILGFLENQQFEFQPYATGDPYLWTASGLPDGLALNSSTGLISGSVEISGVWEAQLNAINYDGTSADAVVTIGIQPGPKGRFGCPTLLVETNTGAVFMPGPEGKWQPVIDDKGKVTPALWLKRGDIPPIIVQFANADAYADLALTSLKLTVKHHETEAVILTVGGLASANKMLRVGASRPDLVHYVMVDPIVSTPLKDALEEESDEDGTYFYGLAEIEWRVANAIGIGPATIVRTSNTFVVGCERDLNNPD